jgi:polyferredoxin
MEQLNSKSAPAASIVLWLLGIVGVISATGITFYGFAISCETGNVSCSVNALLLESMGIFGIFLASLFVVGGFAVRTKRLEKLHDERIRALEEEWEQRKDS